MNINQEYRTWVETIKARYKQSQTKALLKANQEVIAFYWQLGRDIVEMHVEGEEQPAGSIKEEVAAVGEEFVGAAEEIEKMGSVAMADANKTPEEMTVEELQQKILH